MATFKGYDWTELCEAFGIEQDEKNEDVGLERLCKYLRDASDDPVDVALTGTHWVADACRDFLVALIEQERRVGTRAPVFEALLELDDFELFQMMIQMMPMFWT